MKKINKIKIKINGKYIKIQDKITTKVSRYAEKFFSNLFILCCGFNGMFILVRYY